MRKIWTVVCDGWLWLTTRLIVVCVTIAMVLLVVVVAALMGLAALFEWFAPKRDHVKVYERWHEPPRPKAELIAFHPAGNPNIKRRAY